MQFFPPEKKKLNPKLSASKNCRTVAAWKTEWRLGTPHPNPAHSPPKKGSVVPLKFALPTYFFLWHSGKSIRNIKHGKSGQNMYVLQKNPKNGYFETTGIPGKGHPSEIRPL